MIYSNVYITIFINVCTISAILYSPVRSIQCYNFTINLCVITLLFICIHIPLNTYIHIHTEGFIRGSGTEETLSRASYYLKSGSLEYALREMDGLKGYSATLAR